MFEDFFHLRESPFSLAPDPKFLYRSPEHDEALAHLRYWIENAEGFVLITGEVGTGKTTALYDLMAQIPTEWSVAFISHSTLTSMELLLEICRRFHIEVPAGATKPQILGLLEDYLDGCRTTGRGALLIIDEAQNLEKQLLEEVRLLSNMERLDGKLLQIALVGQPELEVKLMDPELRQLRQRIGIKYTLQPLSEAQVVRYIHHRIEAAGGIGEAVFPVQSCLDVHRLTGGIPREINVVASQALINAFAAEVPQVEPAHVAAVTQEFQFRSITQVPSSPTPSPAERYEPVTPVRPPAPPTPVEKPPPPPPERSETAVGHHQHRLSRPAPQTPAEAPRPIAPPPPPAASPLPDAGSPAPAEPRRASLDLLGKHAGADASTRRGRQRDKRDKKAARKDAASDQDAPSVPGEPTERPATAEETSAGAAPTRAGQAQRVASAPRTKQAARRFVATELARMTPPSPARDAAAASLGSRLLQNLRLRNGVPTWSWMLLGMALLAVLVGVLQGRFDPPPAPGANGTMTMPREMGQPPPDATSERSDERSDAGRATAGVPDVRAATIDAVAPSPQTARSEPSPPSFAQTPGGLYAIHVASFQALERGDRLAEQLRRELRCAVAVVPTEIDGRTWHRVYAGEFATRKEAVRAVPALLATELAASTQVMRRPFVALAAD